MDKGTEMDADTISVVVSTSVYMLILFKFMFMSFDTIILADNFENMDVDMDSDRHTDMDKNYESWVRLVWKSEICKCPLITVQILNMENSFVSLMPYLNLKFSFVFLK